MKKIHILVDNDSWIIPYAERLTREIAAMGFAARFVREAENIENGWLSFLLGCTQLVSNEILLRSEHNLVVHESDLPKGRGFAPMAWQILEGKTRIPISLIEAVDGVDEGMVWLKDEIVLEGHELCHEWRNLQGMKTVELCRRFVEDFEHLDPQTQTGEPTYYPRRRPADSELDITRSIEEQFQLLRVVDNDRYPAYFEKNGTVYELRISKKSS